jgi:hypothetical protein
VNAETEARRRKPGISRAMDCSAEHMDRITCMIHEQNANILKEWKLR